VAKDGTVFATDTTGARVLRLKKGASALDEWAADKMLLATADGIALLADGAVYVNSVGQGTLLRIPVKADGSAGTITKVGSRTLLLVEGAGRLDEVTITGDKAEVKILKASLRSWSSCVSSIPSRKRTWTWELPS
jgi:sugar lactone lactonase YvrE